MRSAARGEALAAATAHRPEEHGGEAHGRHREGRRMEGEDEHGHRSDGDQADAEHGALGLGRGRDRRAEIPMMDRTDDDGRDRGGGETREHHVVEEGATGEMEMAEHDQVRQVRPREQERARIGEKQAAVHQRCLPLAAAAGGVDEHRGQEGDGRVEVEQGRHADHEDDGPSVEGQSAGGGPGQCAAARGEQPVLVGDESDQEQAGDQDERRPILHRSRPGIVRSQDDGRDQGAAAEEGEAPLERAWDRPPLQRVDVALPFVCVPPPLSRKHRCRAVAVRAGS